MAHSAPPLALPRALIFLASLWLIGSWFLAIGIRPPVQPSASSYEPGVRLMLLCVTTGLMIGWPLLRLSQSPSPAPLRQTLLDLAVLLAMMQVVIWLLRLVTTWPPMRTLAIDATLAGWAVLAGAMVAAAIGSRRAGPRNLAMLACLGLCLLAPALAVLGIMGSAHSMSLIELSPLLAVRWLGDGGRTLLTIAEWRWIGLLWVAAGLVWLALGLCTALQRRSSAAQAP
jgi:hypothetical protein